MGGAAIEPQEVNGSPNVQGRILLTRHIFSAQGVCQSSLPQQAHEAQSSAPVTQSQIGASDSQAPMNSMAEGGMAGMSLLTPPGIMVGKAGQWMVSYQFLFDDIGLPEVL